MGTAQSTLNERAKSISWIGAPRGEVQYEGQAYFREYQNATLWAVGAYNPDMAKSSVGNAYAIYGAIRDYHVSIGRGKAVTGAPVSDETVTSDGRGRFNQMQNGYIYWTATTGAHEIYGNILLHWTGLGAEKSWLGYPLTGELGIAGGRMNSFENGQIIWQNGTATARSYKDILVQKYNQLGGIYSRLGLPLSADMPVTRTGKAFTMSFRGGYISIPFDQSTPSAVVTQTIQVNWVGLECQVRQESEDELAGAVMGLVPSTKWNKTTKFPSSFEPWKLGHSGARIMNTRVPIYEGPPANVILTTALVELDNNAGNASAVADKVVGVLGNAATWLDRTGAMTGSDVLSGYGRELGGIMETFRQMESRDLWSALFNLFDSPDDPYPVGVLVLNWEDIQRHALPKKVLRRSDDPNVITYTDSVTVTGRDNGGDVGVYCFYFDASIITGQSPL